MNNIRVAIPIWSSRVCTVFDFAQRLLIVDLEGGKELRQKEYTLENIPPLIRASRLLHLNAQILICGAISKPLRFVADNYGIQVHPFITGKTREVIHAWLEGNLKDEAFIMPGCGSRRRCRNRIISGRKRRHDEKPF